MTSNHRKRKEKTPEKTYTLGNTFTSALPTPLPKLRTTTSGACTMLTGCRAQPPLYPKHFESGWKQRLGLFLSASALTATTALISD